MSIKKLVVFLLIAFVLFAAGGFWLTVNVTKSFPLGIYLNSSKTPKKGDLVVFCPPQNEVFDTALERGYLSVGFCPGGYGYMIKKILAAKNDAVVFEGNGVVVNGHLLPNSASKITDSSGKVMPQIQGRYILAGGEILLMSDYNPESFDARYFGIIQSKQIESVIIPFITW